MSRDDRQKWDSRYADDVLWQEDRAPFPWLVEHAPACAHGLALDVACGLGHNALWLAGQGYRVIAADGSRVGLRRGQVAARRAGFADRILFVQADMDTFRPMAGRFDLVCVIRFLNRDLFPWIAAALKPEGTLIYATFNWQWAEQRPETKMEYLLQPGELLRAFPGMRVSDHREAGGMSYLAAFKPSGS